MTQSVLARRVFLSAALALPAGACTTSGLFGQSTPRYTLSPRGDRLVRWIQNSGKDNMMAPEAPALMGITNEGRDIPVRQLAQDDGSDRLVVNLTNMRKMLFPSLLTAYEHWVRTGNLDKLLHLSEASRDHWMTLAQEIVALHGTHDDDLQHKITTLVENNAF